MGSIIQVGPFAFALERLAAMVAILLFIAIVGWTDGRAANRTDTRGWIAVAAGILVARFAYVIDNLAAFASDPLSALYLWQGGFDARFGVAAAAAVLFLTLQSRARWMSLGALALLGAAWFAFAAIALREEPSPLPNVASVVDLDGASAALASRRGPFVVNLWASWCPPCRREMPMLAQVAAANPDVPVLLLNQGEEPAAVRSYALANRIDHRLILIDTDGGLARELQAEALPMTLFIDSGGRIVKTHLGEISRAALLAGIRDLKSRE